MKNIGIDTDIEDTVAVKRKKPVRSWSGVVVITVTMKPDKFSCPYNCKYCPNEPGQPRSYLSSEPAVARANQVGFDAVAQFNERANMLVKMGHVIDKVEIIVLGGTFSTYPKDYAEEFIRDLFYAANTYDYCSDYTKRDKSDLYIEKWRNEGSKVKIIGISLETRPDQVKEDELVRFRTLGCTRVQLGIQHTDDMILKMVNRGHTVKQGVDAIKMLKQAGFKVDIHIMPDLPGATPEGDMKMMKTILTHQDYSVDYLKIYPCLDVDFTEIRKWKKEGKWYPYADEDKELMLKVCLEAKRYSQYYTRFNRIQRDFPEERTDVLGYKSVYIRSNFRQMLMDYAKKHDVVCKCIRCREVKGKSFDESYKIFYDYYRASDGEECFISAMDKKREILFGFIRIRFQKEFLGCFKEIKDCALIRELHVYGNMVPTKSSINGTKSQHKGLGKQLVNCAEQLAKKKKYDQIAVISGVGVRSYYRKLGYSINYGGVGEYMTKQLPLYRRTDIFELIAKWITIVILNLLCFKLWYKLQGMTFPI